MFPSTLDYDVLFKLETIIFNASSPALLPQYYTADDKLYFSPKPLSGLWRLKTETFLNHFMINETMKMGKFE